MLSTRQEMINRANAILHGYTDVVSLTFAKIGDAYDAKLRLRGAGFAVLKMHWLGATDFAALNIYQMSLFISDIRADQHDLVSYEIADHNEDCVLWRCQSIVLIANGERIELQ